MLKIVSQAVTAGALSLAMLSPAAAQDAQTMVGLAELGGVMHAAAETCGTYSSSELAEMKSQQMVALKEMGVSEADFNTAFDSGFSQGKEQIAGATAEQKKEMCDELAKMK
ncbi:hypothetical protein ACLPHM_16310 [Paenalcaligenes sp. Me131]|uniref:hypothetical protein n=1 Tax=Paenalcaligenes sp. Me131 TaxID=3392636 RepID=UPI003D2D0624